MAQRSGKPEQLVEPAKSHHVAQRSGEPEQHVELGEAGSQRVAAALSLVGLHNSDEVVIEQVGAPESARGGTLAAPRQDQGAVRGRLRLAANSGASEAAMFPQVEERNAELNHYQKINCDEIKRLVMDGELGKVPYERELIFRKAIQVLVLYRFMFDLDEIYTTRCPIIVYRGQAESLVAGRAGSKLPMDCDHLLRAIGTADVRNFVTAEVNRSRDHYIPAPDGQCVWTTPYDDVFDLKAEDGYAYAREAWLQSGNRESPGHVDHGRVLSYIPPALTHTFKIWVAFVNFSSAHDFSFGYDYGAFTRMVENSNTVVVV